MQQEMNGWTGERRTDAHPVDGHGPLVCGGPVVVGPRDQRVEPFLPKNSRSGWETGAHGQAGGHRNKTAGGPWLEREGLDERRGKIFAKSIRWAEWD